MFKRRRQPRDAEQVLRLAVSDARVMGLLYTLAGACGVLLGALAIGWDRRDGQIVMATTSLLMLAPGIVYLLVAASLRRADAASATLGVRVAGGHVVAITLGIAMIAFVPRRSPLTIVGGVSIVGVFFVPALLAFIYHIVQARRAARAMSGPGRAFQVQPVQAIPVGPVVLRPHDEIGGAPAGQDVPADAPPR